MRHILDYFKRNKSAKPELKSDTPEEIKDCALLFIDKLQHEKITEISYVTTDDIVNGFIIKERFQKKLTDCLIDILTDVIAEQDERIEIREKQEAETH